MKCCSAVNGCQCGKKCESAPVNPDNWENATGTIKVAVKRTPPQVVPIESVTIVLSPDMAQSLCTVLNEARGRAITPISSSKLEGLRDILYKAVSGR